MINQIITDMKVLINVRMLCAFKFVADECEIVCPC